MNDKLKLTLAKIQQLAKQNSEFKDEMRKMFGEGGNDYVVTDDIRAIREALEIRAMPSITYTFIDEQRIKDQLIIDNLRMENAALNLKLSEQERLNLFCVNAFYQLENLLNYFYHKTYSNIDTILSEIENYTSQEKTAEFDYSFKRKYEANVSAIPMYHKINAFCNCFFPQDNKLKINLNNIRKVRNVSEHRSDVNCNQEMQLNEYFNINAVRIYLKQIVEAVKNNIGKKNTMQNITSWKLAKIKAILPSACFVEVDGKTIDVPNKLLSKVKNKNPNEEISVFISKNKIIDIKI